MRALLPVLAVMVVGLVGGACSGPATLQTHSLAEAPTIDGSLSEWGGALTPVKDRSVSMSVLPTDSLLYVALLIQDRELIRSVARKGLILWVDPTGKTRHTYGLRYPYGLQAQRQQPGGPQAGRSSGPSAAFEKVLATDAGIIRNDTLRRRMPPGFSSGLRLKASLDSRSLIYEVAIPTGASSKEAQLGLRGPVASTLGVGLQTPEADDEPSLSGQTSGVPSVAGRGRRGRSPRGRRRRRQRSARQMQNELPTLDLWVRVVSAPESGA